jgi:sucrose-6-phosphate hydrolase SacC (GH32 family)
VPVSLAQSREPIDLQLFFDRSTLEVFAAGGRYVVTTVHYPPPECSAIAASSRGGRGFLTEVELYGMRGVW